MPRPARWPGCVACRPTRPSPPHWPPGHHHLLGPGDLHLDRPAATDLIQDADAILLAAAAGGADLPDLALLATEMIERSAVPDGDDGGFSDRALWLEKTLAGAGRLTGDLTPGCAAALTAVLEALGSKTGPEDTRSLTQRHHDALEEACHRLIAANMVPGRDGQPLHLYAHADLARPGRRRRVGDGQFPG